MQTAWRRKCIQSNQRQFTLNFQPLIYFLFCICISCLHLVWFDLVWKKEKKVRFIISGCSCVSLKKRQNIWKSMIFLIGISYGSSRHLSAMSWVEAINQFFSHRHKKEFYQRNVFNRWTLICISTASTNIPINVLHIIEIIKFMHSWPFKISVHA